MRGSRWHRGRGRQRLLLKSVVTFGVRLRRAGFFGAELRAFVPCVSDALHRRRWRGRCGDGSNHGAGQRISTAPSPLNGGRVRGLPIMSWDGSRRSSDIRRWRLLGTLSAVAGKGGFAGHRRVARSPHSPPSSGPPLVRSAGLSSRSAGWWGAAAAPSAHTNVRPRRAHRVAQHTRRREILVQIVRVAINPRARLQRWTKAPVVLRSMPCTMIVPAWAARGEHASQ